MTQPLSDAGRADRTDLAARIEQLSNARWGDASPTALIGTDASMRAVQQRLLQFAQADSPLLITGETGTGKELFARAIFLLCSRQRGPFLKVNCAQYADGQLIASELFGHKRGSFTGAVADHRGLFEEANGGVLFLDEVGELTLPAQAMLLRVLSEREIVPVGETRARHVNTRVVAATSRDLRAMVATGAFRADLYYRLRFLQLRIPALRERGDDWRLLTRHFLKRAGARLSVRKGLSAQSWSLLSRYSFPGNVRELQGITDIGFYSSEGELIEPESFAHELESPCPMPDTPAAIRTYYHTPPHGFPAISLDAPHAPHAPHAPATGMPTNAYGARDGATADARPHEATDVYERMRAREACFWTAVYEPFMSREINRGEVRRLVDRGLHETRGSYKRLTALFGIEEEDYLKFMDFLRHHRLKPER